MPADEQLRAAMIGPVPVHWGGGRKWRGGGVATHVEGLLPGLARLGVRIAYLADNVAAGGREPRAVLDPAVLIERVARSPAGLARLGARRWFTLAVRSMRRERVRRLAPPAQLLRYLALAGSYDAFLARHPAALLHVQQAGHRQYLCQELLDVCLPVIVTLQSANDQLRPEGEWVVRMLKHNLRHADHLIAVSHYVKEMAVDWGADPQRVTVIPNGVDAARFQPHPAAAARAELGLPADAYVVLFSGNLVPRKGVDVLIPAFARLHERRPEARLVIVGAGAEEGALRRLAAETGVGESVVFAGFRPLTEMPRWYQACDVFVMPSWAEGLSLAVLEAMACARPVITTWPDRAGHDAIQDGQNGRLVPYGQENALAQALISLAEQAETAATLGRAARETARTRFTWPEIAARTVEVYRQVLDQRRPGS